MVSFENIQRKVQTWKLPILVISIILALVGAALRWAGSSETQTALSTAQINYLTSLFFFIPFFNALTHFTGKPYGLFVALGIFFFNSPTLMGETHENRAHNVNSDVQKLIAGNVLLLLGDFLSFIVFPFPQAPVVYFRWLIVGLIIVAFNFIGCIIFWHLLDATPFVINKASQTIWFQFYWTTPVQMFYLTILFILSMLGSKASQVLTVFLGGSLLPLLDGTLNSDQYRAFYSGSEVDELRAAHAIHWISLVLMIAYILFFTSRKTEESDNDFNSLYSDETYTTVS